MRLPILIAAEGGPWEAQLVVDFERPELGITVVRRCVDIVDLLAIATTGQARVAVISAGLRHLDANALDRLTAAGVVAVGVVGRADSVAETRLRAIGVEYLVPDDADTQVIAAVIDDAASAGPEQTGPAHTAYSVPPSSGGSSGSAPPGVATPPVVARGSVVAVWGPPGAPGRTTVAVTVADELARLGREALLVDADVYGGVVSQLLGLLDESPGLAAACRQASSTRLTQVELAASCWQVRPGLRVLTGIPRAERWTELRPAAVTSVLATARGLADFTVLDCAFCLESDEELSFDTLAPRRNGATLAILEAADLIVVVGAADPVGLQRLVRGLTELTDTEISTPVWVVLNKVRAGVVAGDPVGELAAALTRFAGRPAAAFLPYDRPALDAALVVGRTLGETAPGSGLRIAIADLAAAIAGVSVPRRGRRRRAS